MKYAAYDNYKPSGIEWLGDVPSHWLVARSDGIISSERRQVQPEVFLAEDVFHYSIPAVQECGTGAVEEGESIKSAKQPVVRKSLLVSKLNPRKSTITVAEPQPNLRTLCSTEFVTLFADKCDLGFLTYVTISEAFRQRLDAAVQSVTRSHQRANPRDIYSFWNAWPPLDEQQTIARFLDAKTAQIDALLVQKQQLIARLKEKRSALITRTVTRGLPPEAAKAAGLEQYVEMKGSGVDWIGHIPSTWKIERLRRVCRRVTDGAHISPDLSSDDFPFVSTVDIANGKIDMKNCLRTSVECYDYLVRTGCRPFSGDVLFSKDGTVGRTAVVDFSADFVVASSLVIISPNSRHLNFRFLDYWLNNNLLQQEVTLQMAGAALRRISVEKIGRLPVLLPPPNEQQAIVLYLDGEAMQLDSLVAKAEAAIDRLTEYRQALITSAVTGKIDVRELA